MVAALAVLGATPAAAQLASERTTIKIDEAVMVPGATLQPGTYVFELTDPTSCPARRADPQGSGRPSSPRR
jgi:hypothetical protein